MADRRRASRVLCFRHVSHWVEGFNPKPPLLVSPHDPMRAITSSICELGPELGISAGSAVVLGAGLEPACLSAYAPQTYVSAIPPPERFWNLEDGRWETQSRKRFCRTKVSLKFFRVRVFPGLRC